jgi:hypothetical protein
MIMTLQLIRKRETAKIGRIFILHNANGGRKGIVKKLEKESLEWRQVEPRVEANRAKSYLDGAKWYQKVGRSGAKSHYIPSNPIVSHPIP